MAGMEKICEFSGEYPGWLMYSYKRNHIQIIPKYRKLFRGADAVLIINEKRICYKWKTGGYCSIEPMDCKSHNEFYKTNYSFDEFVKNYEKIQHYSGGKIVTEHYFTLKVSNPELQGKVEGEYVNWTFNLRQTKKRLKRMLRCKALKVKHEAFKK
jgi:hypothetical protein